MHSTPLDNVRSLSLFGPELALTVGILLVLLCDLCTRGKAKVAGVVTIALATLACAGGLAISYVVRGGPPTLLFGGLLASDRFAHVFRILSAVVTTAVVLFSVPVQRDDGENETQRAFGEFYVLLLTVSLGLNLMAMSHNLLMIYLSLELVSVISFVLAGYKIADRRSSEAALKYVVFGGVASGVLLYGSSWLYGITQSLDLAAIGRRVVSLSIEQNRVPGAVVIAVICMLVGFGYKISAAPFHMWTPDVYEGAPTPITAFLSVGPKAAGFAILIRFFSEALNMQVSGGVGSSLWPVLGGLLAMATMTVGNLSALGQKSVKRMLAYSSIAHAGYMLLGFCVFSDAGSAAILFYVATYCLMNLGAFLVVLTVAERSRGDESVEAFVGLGSRAPLLAGSMAVFLFSLTGLPPFAGFVGKFYIFAALLRAGGSFNWLLATVGVLNSVVSLFYYARVLRAMYLTPTREAETVVVRGIYKATMLALLVPTVVLGVYWSPVYDFVARSLTMAR